MRHACFLPDNMFVTLDECKCSLLELWKYGSMETLLCFLINFNLLIDHCWVSAMLGFF